MRLQTFLEKIQKIPNGAFFHISWTRELPLYKQYQGSNIIVLKTVETVARKGIKPWNTKLGKQTYQPGETHKLPWGLWKKGYEGIILEHKEKNYIRIFTVSNLKPKVQYYINGRPIDKETLKNMNIVTKVGWSEIDITTQDFFCVAIDNVIEIN